MSNDIVLTLVKKKHKCHQCKRLLLKKTPRVEIGMYDMGVQPKKYCLVCGVKYIENKLIDWANLLGEIKEKHTKDIVAQRLLGD